MRQNYFFEYVPNAYINLCVDKAQQMANNRFVYDFKAGDKKAAHSKRCFPQGVNINKKSNNNYNKVA